MYQYDHEDTDGSKPGFPDRCTPNTTQPTELKQDYIDEQMRSVGHKEYFDSRI